MPALTPRLNAETQALGPAGGGELSHTYKQALDLFCALQAIAALLRHKSCCQVRPGELGSQVVRDENS